MSQWNMRSATKIGKSEVCQIIWDDPKWNTGSNYVGRGEYCYKIQLNSSSL